MIAGNHMQISQWRRLDPAAALHRGAGAAAPRVPAAARGRAQGRGGNQHCRDESDDRRRDRGDRQRQVEGAAVQRGEGPQHAGAGQCVSGAHRVVNIVEN